MHDDELVVHLLHAAAVLTKRLDRSLASIKGISFSEYQLLSALGRQPAATAPRSVLAEHVGVTPSGVTRALKPLEKLGFVETDKDGRDARRSLARLTPAGVELVSDAAGVVADVVDGVDAIASLSVADRAQLVEWLDELAR
ncbi:MAG: MarR family transcriptional regulator [Acidimicrobiales bacterium]|nr:MarR family transcriptional regulator [Acidimicrobiales bacterium]